MDRRDFLKGAALAAAGCRASAPAMPAPFEFEEAGIGDLRAAMESGRESAVSLAEKFLARIAAFDKRVNSVIELNPDAAGLARELDRERASKGLRGPLHGIPILIKDNIDTHDRMTTTAGSLALEGSIAPRDAFVARRLREAGAVILGKTNLSEWANFRSNRSTSGWSGRGGQTKNPHVLDRNPSGSSSGSAAAVAAGFCAAAVGTETDGSIISPSALCGIVGLKPTVGLVSRAGIIPIAHSQDTAGPMARSVTDAAILLGAMVGVDPRDAATAASEGKSHADYTRSLDRDGLRGARIGVARRFFGSGVASKVLASALEALKAAGAELVDPADEKGLGRVGNAEFEVMLYEFKAGLNAYLEGLGPSARVRSLAELIEFNERHADREMPYFGQEILVQAQAKGPLTDEAYVKALERCRRMSRDEGIDAVMEEHRLDAIVAPSGGPAAATDLIYGDRGTGGSSSPAAVAGYPNITVPAGQVHGLPVGISFFGRAYSEPVLLRIAFGFEQATRARRTPKFLPTLG
jgi:amidase